MIQQRLRELDSLRGLVALSVVFFHFTAGRPEFYSCFKFGGTAVDLFFMISGFVIFLTVSDNPSWMYFAKKRFLRLYPTYWICLIITTVVMIINLHHLNQTDGGLLTRFLANITMFQSYLKIEDMDGPYWSLAIELMFYIFVIFMLIAKVINKIEIIGYLIFILIAFLYWYALPQYPLFYHSINRAIPLINHWPLFFAGILFYRQMNVRETLFRYLSIIICFAFSILVFNKAGRTSDFISIAEYASILFVYFFTFFLLINNRLGFLKIRALLFLGSISYTLYLIHQYIGREFLLKNLTGVLKINFAISCCISVMFSILLSAVVTFYLEIRLRNWLRKYLFSFRN